MLTSTFVCIVSLLVLLWILRRDQMSLGLPLAYICGLLLIHVPGAAAHILGGRTLGGDDVVSLGIMYAALGTVCFVAGVWLARGSAGAAALARLPGQYAHPERLRFAVFCLIGGWVFVYGLAPIGRLVPSIGAAIDKGGAVWLLGVLLGLRAAFAARKPIMMAQWGAALMVYPALGLVLGGFLSYGSAAVIVACSVLAITARNYWRAMAGIAVVTIIGLNIFANYFAHRNDIRDQVWGGAPMAQRIDSVESMFTDIHLLSTESPADLNALDLRLNQNFFVGVAAQRIHDHVSDYLYGATLWDGVLSLVPRALWADKPITAGSGHIVAEATGLKLSDTTSWGVGNVMEFYINFGMPGLVIGFVALGWLLGWLDLKAAIAERRGDFSATIMNFLPAVALIQPNGSMVEVVSGAAAAYVGALGWSHFWPAWLRFRGGRGATATLTPVFHARAKAPRPDRRPPY